MTLNNAAAESNFDNDMAALIGGEPAPQPRDNGRFAAREQAAPFDNDAELVESEPKRGIGDNKGPELEHVEPAKAKADKAEAEDDEDYIELPATEEGKEPERLKLNDVLAGYRKVGDLEKQVTEYRNRSGITPDVEKIVNESQKAREQYIANAQELMRYMRPQMPSRELVNPQSQNYNPELYHQLLGQFEAMSRARQEIEADANRVYKEHQANQAELQRVHMARVVKEIHEFAPELRDPQRIAKFMDGAKSAYGFSQQELDAIGDARVMRVLLDAEHGRQHRATAETVKKAVAAKPKLVKSSARSSPTGKQAGFDKATERLSRSNSVDDAAAAIAHLL